MALEFSAGGFISPPARGAVLGLPGLLLGFSFAMAVGRYETRRSLVDGEADHVPGAVLLSLPAVTGCGACSNGLNSGIFGRRTAFSQLIFPLLIAVVITLITDIDSQRRGVIGASQKPIEDLLTSIHAPGP